LSFRIEFSLDNNILPDCGDSALLPHDSVQLQGRSAV